MNNTTQYSPLIINFCISFACDIGSLLIISSSFESVLLHLHCHFLKSELQLLWCKIYSWIHCKKDILE